MTKNVAETETTLLHESDPRWYGGGFYGEPNAETIERRFRELDEARAKLGLQPLTAEERAAQLQPTAPPALTDADVKAKLATLAKAPVGPSPETAESLARIQAEHDAKRAALQATVTRQLAPAVEKSVEATKAVAALAKEFRAVLVELQNVPSIEYLRALPVGEASHTLVVKLSETVDSVLLDFKKGADRILDQREALRVAVESIAGTGLTPQEKATILHERAALDNLSELPGSITARLRMVLALREEIARLSQVEGERAVTAAALPTREQTPEDRTALARKITRGN